MSRSRWTLPLLLALCLGTRLWFLARLPWCAEDAYITFRYAAHWAQGLGPVFNPGERAWGFTSALWTAFLAATTALHLPIEGTARAVLVGCDLATLALAWRLLAPRSRGAAVAFGAFFALWPRFAFLPSTGLESSLVVALLFAAAAAADGPLGGLCNGLLALARPEGAAMSLVLAWRLSWRQRAVWLGVAALQGGLMLWFGRLFPSSVSSKAMVYGVQAKGLYWFEWLLPGVPPQTADGIAIAPLAIVLLAGAIAAIVRWRRAIVVESDEPLPLLFACGVLTLAGYTALGVPWYYWYAPAPTLAVLLAVCLGLGTADALRWTVAPAALFVILAWPGVAADVERLQVHDARAFAYVGRTLKADAAGRDAAVLLEPIGIVGWTSGLRVVDEVGLVTPWVAEERARGDGWYARTVARARPRYLVFRQHWLEGGVTWAGVGAPFASPAQRDSLLRGYVAVSRRAAGPPPPGAGRLVVLRRKGQP